MIGTRRVGFSSRRGIIAGTTLARGPNDPPGARDSSGRLTLSLGPNPFPSQIDPVLWTASHDQRVLRLKQARWYGPRHADEFWHTQSPPLLWHTRRYRFSPG